MPRLRRTESSYPEIVDIRVDHAGVICVVVWNPGDIDLDRFTVSVSNEAANADHVDWTTIDALACGEQRRVDIPTGRLLPEPVDPRAVVRHFLTVTARGRRDDRDVDTSQSVVIDVDRNGNVERAR